MKVQSFKLVTGEEIVARVLDQTDTHFTIEQAQVLQFQPVGNGQLGLAFVPWALSNPDVEVKLPVTAVVTNFNASTQVEKQYVSQTSKIALMG
jgi:hypothetical protein